MSESDLEELSAFSLASHENWDVEKFLAKEWCKFSPDLAASHLGLEIFELSQLHGYGDPLEYTYKCDSSGRVTKANLLFRRIGHRRDWLEDFIFYGRGNLPKGHRWVDHCRVELNYITLSAPTLFECRNNSKLDIINLKNRYIGTCRFWYSAEFKSDIPAKPDRKNKCKESCSLCWWKPEEKNLVPVYITKTTYTDKGESISERHFTTPESTFSARPSKRWLRGVPYNKVTGRKFEITPVTDDRYDQPRLHKRSDWSEFRPPTANKVPQFIYDSTSSEDDSDDFSWDSEEEDFVESKASA